MPTLASIIKRSVIIVAGAAITLIPAFVNGYPFVYSDTGTYIESAFTGYVPFDRPYWYGPFLWAASLSGFSLWGVAAVQALLCAAYILRVCHLVVPAREARTFLIACTVLALGSSLGWYTARVIPDVFTGIGMLAVYTLLQQRGAGWRRIMDGLVILAACWMHTSNLLILPISGALLLLMCRRDNAAIVRRGATWLVATTAISWGGVALANRAIEGEAYVSRGSHVFLMGRMLDMGMLKPYLDEHCAQEEFAICAYRDSLPANSQAFLWSDRSPLAKQGGWNATKEEYGRIVHGSFTEPRYLWLHVRGSLSSTAEQLCAWEICHAMESQWYRTETSPPYMSIRKHLPHEFQRFMGALQNGGRGELSMRIPDFFYRVVLGFSLATIALALLRRRGDQRRTEAMLLARYALIAVIIGAWVCASLSVVDTRYLGRDSWLLPLAAVFLIVEGARARKTATS